MSYQRPQNDRPLSKAEKLQLLKAHALHYRMLAGTDPSALNRKVPRDAFSELIQRIGQNVVDESGTLAASPGLVRDFLDANPLPPATSPPSRFVSCFLPDTQRSKAVGCRGTECRRPLPFGRQGT